MYCATIFSYISRVLCDGKTENKDVNQNALIGGNNAKPIILCPDMDEEKIREIKGIGIYRNYPKKIIREVDFWPGLY